MTTGQSEHAIVVGTGFGGLAAALRLRAKGYRVTVVEAHADPGGRARQFTRDGFQFDAGPTVVTANYLFDELYELFGKKREDYFKLLPVDPFYRVQFHDRTEFDYVGDEERLLQQIEKFEPSDVEGYRRLAKHAQRIFEVGYLQLADQPFSRVSDMLRVIPDMVKLENYRTVYSLVSKYLKNEKLRQVFTFQPLLVGGNPFQTTSIYLLIHWLEREWGVQFAQGGTYSIIQGLIRLAQEEGIEFKFNHKVTKVNVTGQKVSSLEINDGQERLACDLAVFNGDPTNVYLNLMDPSVLSKHKPWREKLKKQSMSLFVLYFGTDKVYDNLAHHTIVLGPRYRELLDDIFVNYKLADDFSLYLHAPGRTDETMYPSGKDGFYVLSPVPNQKAKVDWSQIGDAYAQKILQSLEERCMPGLTQNIATQFHITPDYFEKEMMSRDGAAFGLEPIFRQSAYFRYHNQSEDVQGLYFVGASTHPGAGMPGVLCTAKVLDHIVAPARVKYEHAKMQKSAQTTRAPETHL